MTPEAGMDPENGNEPVSCLVMAALVARYRCRCRAVGVALRRVPVCLDFSGGAPVFVVPAAPVVLANPVVTADQADPAPAP